MQLLRRSIKWVMLLAGVLTCTMFYALVAPEASLVANFGQSLEGPVAQIVVRNWGALISLMGILLIYGAFKEEARTLALLLAGASKLVFVVLVLTLGQPFLRFQAGVAIALDAVFILVFGVYLVAHRSRALAPSRDPQAARPQPDGHDR